MTAQTDEQKVRERESLLFARTYLSDYYATHRTGVREVITSQWTRGLVSGRTEALNILADAARRIDAERSEG